MNPAIAAGHPATAEAGAAVLEAGGSAADAACAAVMAACVAETVMTGLLGGGHAVYWDEASGEAWNLDCFCSVPAGEGGDLVELAVPFGEELVHYAVGPASFAVPGIPAGLGALHERFGRLPWAELCKPAMTLARIGVDMPAAHAACLAMLAPVMTLDGGERIYAPEGKLLGEGDRLRQPGLEKVFALLAREGASSVYSGSLAETVLSFMQRRGGGRVTREDLAGYEAQWDEPVEVEYAGTRVLTRGGLSGLPELLVRLPALRGLDETERVLLLLPLLEARGAETHTTNVTVVDGDGNACAFTTSLGLGSGDFLPGLDLHLNSMLGEVDLLVGELAPGTRMASMMAPMLAIDADGLALAAGAAGGTRLRTALALVLAGVLDEGLDPQAAVDRPRFHPAGGLVNAEPGVDEDALAQLEASGRAVRRWPERHHYFGGVSAVARGGAAADPRRSGAVQEPR
ncbi:MAG: gamma-glutamyltranspeptidase / glutathione hydrolase [Gaiellaceae bacterium]|nr:gamma-glutamyltranspeptidase / glutathione hydrolase [Gaiellaceae bacterium]